MENMFRIKKELYNAIRQDISNVKGYTAKEIEEDLLPNLRKSLNEEVAIDAENIVKTIEIEAQKFYTTLQRLSQTRKSVFTKISLGNMSKNYELKTYRLRLAYLAAFNFSRYIHKYLDLPLAKALIVFENDEGVPYTKEITLEELVMGAGSAGHLHKNWLVSPDKVKAEEQSAKEKDVPQEHLQKLQLAYDTIKKKMEDKDLSYVKKDTSGKYKDYHSYIQLKKRQTIKEYHTFYITNLGDLKEAYATALLQEHGFKMDALMKADKTDVENLAYTFYKNYVTQVDNKEALLGEDILTTAIIEGESRPIQYAVKASNAQLPSLSQYVRVAVAIVKNRRTVQDVIEEEQKKYGGYARNKIASQTDKAIDKVI